MINAPQPRYKIVERDRRLVTIDTQSGQVVNATTIAAASENRETAQATAQATSGPSPWTPSPSQQQSAPSRPSSNPGGDKAGRIGILIVAGCVVALILILSGGWIPVGFALLFPPVRTAVWGAARIAIRRFLEG